VSDYSGIAFWIEQSLLSTRHVPVLGNSFPVKLSRELPQEALWRSDFRYQRRQARLKIDDFPVKFPVCREFRWRPVRSALRRQPASV
jgi:hypothetical protein